MGLRPKPPFASVAVYPATDAEDALFRLVCEVLLERRRSSVRQFDVLPAGTRFGSLSDIGPLESVAPARGADVWAALEDAGRPVQAYLVAGGFGPTVVEFSPADGRDRHPVTAYFAAEAHGLPSDRWSKSYAKAWHNLAMRWRKLLRTVCARGQVLYGEIAVEHTMLGPTNIIDNKWGVRGDVFLSDALGDPEIQPSEKWETGVFIPGPDHLDKVNRHLADRLRVMRSR